ncbi:MAG: hypothetical protein FWB93_01020 [Oscillospiraceae bacterium]|nr:hypothetical protein [Oscillospiraceae bacterium]
MKTNKKIISFLIAVIMLFVIVSFAVSATVEEIDELAITASLLGTSQEYREQPFMNLRNVRDATNIPYLAGAPIWSIAGMRDLLIQAGVTEVSAAQVSYIGTFFSDSSRDAIMGVNAEETFADGRLELTHAPGIRPVPGSPHMQRFSIQNDTDNAFDVVYSGARLLGALGENYLVQWLEGWPYDPETSQPLSVTLQPGENIDFAAGFGLPWGVPGSATIASGQVNWLFDFELPAENVAQGYPLTVESQLINPEGDLTESHLQRPFDFSVVFYNETDEFGNPIPLAGEFDYYVHARARQAFTLRRGETFQLRHGEQAIFPDLPEGLRYDVSAITPADFVLVSCDSHSGEIGVGDNHALFVHSYILPSADEPTKDGEEDTIGENVDEDEDIDEEIEEETQETPQTGENTLVMAMIVIATTAFGLICVAVKKRKTI